MKIFRLLQEESVDSLIIESQIKEMVDSPDIYLMRISPKLMLIFSAIGEIVSIIDIIPYHSYKEIYG